MNFDKTAQYLTTENAEGTKNILSELSVLRLENITFSLICKEKKMVNVGDAAPDFTLESNDCKKVSLGDFKGKKVVLYFYPKDNTSGCTKEACSFRDHIEPIYAQNTVVLGISKDSIKSHQNFINKYELNFPLLSDPEGKICEAYGAWGEKKMYGKTYMGIIRKTFIIDEDQKIKYVFEKVKPEGHAEEVLKQIVS